MRHLLLRVSVAIHQIIPRFDLVAAWLTATTESHGNHFGHPLF